MKERRFSVVSAFFLGTEIIIMLLVVILANIDPLYIHRGPYGNNFHPTDLIRLIILFGSPLLSIFAVAIFLLHIYWFNKKKISKRLGITVIILCPTQILIFIYMLYTIMVRVVSIMS